ncbi:cytochrome P450 2K1-like [Hippocampus zosterae]|uniref:cytochrome P450 2K1-like n=1 Tax=Hippocampus zosterae TaxID=109293 RepID=UPI00223E2DD9|nr:cytochrome P450 2K1-like [Hippocampus zosterae]
MFEDILQAPVLFSLSGTFATLLAIRLLLSFRSQPKLVPPGPRRPRRPRRLPLLGNLLQVDLKRLDESLLSLSKTYGPVFTVNFGPKKVVVLAGTKAIKQALINHAEEFGERYITPIFHDFSQGHGLTFANGDSWKEMRRFTLTTLRDFGMGKRLSEEKIIEECHFLIEEFEQHKGEAFDNSKIISYAASNIISGIMFGKRFEYEDKVFQEMIERDHEAIYLSGTAAILLYNMFPRLFCWVRTRKLLLSNRDKNMKEVRELLRQRKEKLNPEMCTGLVDCFFVRKQKEEEGGVESSHFTEENMNFVVGNLFAAGTDTTSTTLQWGLLLMAKYPEIQERVHEELNKVIGNRPIDVDDRKNLSYTNAVVHEVQRFSNIAPMAILHQTTQDITFQGYFIKKGTAVVPLLTSVLYDKSEWETPNTFNPSHFLDKEGNFVMRDAFLPFSAGRRVCLGEGLARMELFLFFTSLMQHFHFTPPPGISEDELDLKPMVGGTNNPMTHQLCAVRREGCTNAVLSGP